VPGFKYLESGNVGYYVIEDFEKSGMAKTCFSTRMGGVSSGEYSQLNLGYKTGDHKEKVNENIDILCREAGFKKEDLVFSDQVHGNKYAILRQEDRGKGVTKASDIVGIDALITNEKNVALSIFTADCVPVFLLDAQKGAIGLCHAGWRGIINEIVPLTIEAMSKNFGSSPRGMLGALGPSIGPCCFNVGREVAEKFENAFSGADGIVIEREENLRVNLWEALKAQLMSSGLLEENIIISGLCTCCHSEKFYSYRRDGAKTGRMVSILQLI